MKIITRWLLRSTVLLPLVLVSGCVRATQPEELNATAFRQHFAAEQSCSKYVDRIVKPASHSMVNLTSISAMRKWISSNPSDAFAALAIRVRRATMTLGPIDPRVEKDQINVTSHILSEMNAVKDLKDSECGPDVAEHFASLLRAALDEENSAIIPQLRKLGIMSPSDQGWILLTALMTGQLEGSIK